MNENNEYNPSHNSDIIIIACIPAFNEEKNIGGVIIRTLKYVDKIIVCDDGSTDLTSQIASKLGALVIRHNNNRGYGSTIQSLFKKAVTEGADFIITLDGDGQHNPDDIPMLLNFLKNGGYDLVIGSRFLAQNSLGMTMWRKQGINFLTKMISKKNDVSDSQSGFRVYSRTAVKKLILTESGMGISTEILIKAKKINLRIGEAPVIISYDENSHTHNPIFHGLDVMISTLKHLSINKPILFYGLPGVSSLTTSLFFWIWTFKIYSERQIIITNITLIALGTLLVGLILSTTAIILWVLTTVVKEAMV